MMNKTVTMGAAKAHRQFTTLLENARSGETTIITKRGKAVAAVVPIGQSLRGTHSRERFVDLHGTGKGMYGDVAKYLDDLWAKRD